MTARSIEIGGQVLQHQGPIVSAGEAFCRAEANTVVASAYVGPVMGAVIEGRFEYQTDQGSSVVGPGAVLLGNRGEAFSCRHLDSLGNRRAVIALDEALVRETAEAIGLSDDRFDARVIPPTQQTMRLYGLARRISKGLPGDEEAAVTLLSQALAVSPPRHPKTIPRTDRRRVRDIALHLAETSVEPWSLSDLSREAGLSRFHFIRAFREVTGDTPHQFLVAARLRLAADRLLDTAEAISHVALGVGFNDVSNFNSTFRRAFGVSPRRWREHGEARQALRAPERSRLEFSP